MLSTCPKCQDQRLVVNLTLKCSKCAQTTTYPVGVNEKGKLFHTQAICGFCGTLSPVASTKIQIDFQNKEPCDLCVGCYEKT